jgi:hypothetical protein
MQIMAQKLEYPPDDPQSINPKISDRMNSIIKKFMAINLDKRVQNWNEALTLLKKSPEKKQSAPPKKMHVKSANAEVAGRIISSSRKKSSPLLMIIAIILSLSAVIIFLLLKE